VGWFRLLQTLRFPAIRIVPILLILGITSAGSPGSSRLIGPTGLQVLQAQEIGEGNLQAQDVALLLRGPEEGKGLPFLRTNVIDHFRGVYSYLEKDILVYYTEHRIVRFETWTPVSCGNFRLYRLDRGQIEASAPGAVFFFRDEDFSLFFAFEAELDCTFVQRFLVRFNYFRSVRDLPSRRPPFPAVVD